MITLAFEADGREVMSASDGRGALDLASRARPDVIVVDLKMPGLDGVEFARRYRSANGDAPLVLVTAAQQPEAAAERMGAAKCVRKPFELDDLFAVIDEAAAGGK